MQNRQQKIDRLVNLLREELIKSCMQKSYRSVIVCDYDDDDIKEEAMEHHEEFLKQKKTLIVKSSQQKIRHDPRSTMQRNAQFLISASEKTNRYDYEILEQMKQAYEREEYDDVIDLAFLHDSSSRKTKQSENLNNMLDNLELV